VKAKEWIDQALDLEGNSPQADVLDHAGDIYFMNREVGKAVDFWEKALKLDPDNHHLKKKIRQRTPSSTELPEESPPLSPKNPFLPIFPILPRIPSLHPSLLLPSPIHPFLPLCLNPA